MAKPENERERIARIIDPRLADQGWVENYAELTSFDGGETTHEYVHRIALAKADEVLAIIVQRESGAAEPVAWRWRWSADSYGVPGAEPGKWQFIDCAMDVPMAQQWRHEVEPLYAAPPAALTVIDPDQWEPCSPAWLTKHPNDCAAAPRVYCESEGNHYHPKNWPSAEAQTRVEALEAVVQRFVAANDEAPEFGVTDCIDNDGEHYQSADYAALILDARALLSGSTPKPAGAEITEEMVGRLKEADQLVRDMVKGEDDLIAAKHTIVSRDMRPWRTQPQPEA